jgi:hypothetical protein
MGAATRIVDYHHDERLYCVGILENHIFRKKLRPPLAVCVKSSLDFYNPYLMVRQASGRECLKFERKDFPSE